MRIKQILSQTQYLSFRNVAAATVLIISGIVLAILYFVPEKKAHAVSTNETMPAGSFIIDMGVSPQTVANGLKPYGMIYDLMVNYQVPVKWVINDSKIRDGNDFTHESFSYKGGPFIIPGSFINSTVSARISYWQNEGVQGRYIATPVSVPVNQTLTSFPTVMIDTTSSLQAIIANYFTNAMIPSQTYTFGIPAGLSGCFDVWTNPHGDPEWTTHSYLRNFVTTDKSWIWAQCHAVSVMESCKGSGQQLNFLTSQGLKCWKANKCGTISESHSKNSSSPYTYYYPTDPVMQFIGNMHDATKAGSEQWFQPVSTGSWYGLTKRGVTTATGSSPNEGVLLVYGPAYGDSDNGWVMYEGGHALDSAGAIPDQVSAQRAFFNFLLLGGTYKKLTLTATIPAAVQSGQSAAVSASVTNGTAPFTYQWTSSLGGTFDNSSASSAQYTAPYVTTDTVDLVTVIVTDNCGRKNFQYRFVQIGAPVTLPVSLIYFRGDYNGSVTRLKWMTSSEVNNDYFTVSWSEDGKIFQNIGTVKGNGTTSEANMYEFTDELPFSGPSYYQLSQTDFDGKTQKYSPVVVQVKKKYKGVFTYPNPFSEQMNIVLEATQDQSATIRIISSAGEMVLESEQMLTRGKNNIRISSEGLPSGIYGLEIACEKDAPVSGRLIKE